MIVPSIGDLETTEEFEQPDIVRELNAVKLDKSVFSKRRDVDGITIDPPGSMDLDDAIHLRALEEGGWLAEISIADVDAIVSMGGSIDREALRRVVTRYFDGYNHPMIPHLLSQNLLSLHVGMRRPTVTISVSLNQDAEMTNIGIARTALQSKQRYTYNRVSEILHHNPNADVLLRECQLLAARLNERRRLRGALVFAHQNARIFIDDDGGMHRSKVSHIDSHMIVEEFMLLANEAVARYAIDAKIPILFRNHREPLEVDRRRQLMNVSKELSDVLEQRPEQAIIEDVRRRFVRLMPRATYGSEREGHFALALHAYSHFTSPIRRYPDIVTHRNVLAAIEGRPLPYSTEDVARLGEYLTEKKLRIDRTHGAYARSQTLPEAQAAYQQQAIEVIRERLQGPKPNYMGALVEMSRAIAAEPPELSIAPVGTLHKKKNVATIVIRDQDGEMTGTGKSRLGMRAKQRAAKSVLEQLGLFDIEPISVNVSKTHSYFSILIEWMQKRQIDLQHSFETVGPLSDQWQIHILSADVPGLGKVTIRAKARRKTDAKKYASIKFLSMLGAKGLQEIPDSANPEISPSAVQEVPEGNPVGELQEFCTRKSLQLPSFNFFTITDGKHVFHACVATVRTKAKTLESEECRGSSKSIAKQLAARSALRLLKEQLNVEPPRPRHTPEAGNLIMFCQQVGWPMPIFHCREIAADTVECKCVVVSPEGEVSECATSSTFAEAQALVAKMMIARFGTWQELLLTDPTQDLMFYCQQKSNSANAVYKMSRQGSQHICVCSFDGVSDIKTGGNARIARKLAAKEVLAKLRTRDAMTHGTTNHERMVVDSF